MPNQFDAPNNKKDDEYYSELKAKKDREEANHYIEVEKVLKDMPKGDYPPEMMEARKKEMLDQIHASNDAYDEAQRRKITAIVIFCAVLFACLMVILFGPAGILTR